MIDAKIETKHIIAELSVTEKICLYNALYEDLAGKGIEGDTELAHVNKAEMVVLLDMGGSGTINPNTGLIQFMGGGSPPPPPPAPSSVSQTSEFPTELRPYIADVLGKAQAIQEKREDEGYRPFEGPQVAEFTPQQQQAFTGVEGLVGAGGQYFNPAANLAASSAVAPTAESVQQYMSPYAQNVIDIKKREALRQADVASQELGAQSVKVGGYGGSRQAILGAEQARNTQTLLADIQARGTAAAYEDAQTRLSQQRQRELAASGQFMNLGTNAPQQALKEFTALEAVGAQGQALNQQALNIARQQFQEEQTFPEQTLQQYQSVIRGFPLAANTYQNSQTTTPAPSYLQQAAGLGATAVGLAGAFGNFKNKGGKVDSNSGLGSIVVKRQEGTRVASPRDILAETNEERVNRVFPGFKPKSLEETYSDITPESSRFTRAIASGLSGVKDFVGEQASQMGRDVTSLGEYLFDAKTTTPLSLAQIRVVQEAEARRPDLAESGSIRKSAKNILRNAEEKGVKVTAEMLGQAMALDLRPITEVGEEVAAADSARVISDEERTLRGRPVPSGLSDDPRLRDNVDPYGIGVVGELGTLSQLAEKINPPVTAPAPAAPTVAAPAPAPAPTVAAPAPTVAAPAPTVAAPAPAVAASEDRMREQDTDDSPYPKGYDAQFAAKLDAATTQSPFSSSRLPDVMRETREELFKAQELRATEKGAELEERRTGLDNDRWLSLANLGTEILAQPGGQTFLQVLGKSAKSSGIISTLSKLNREDAALASKIKDVPLELMQSKFNLKKDEAAYIKDAANYDLKIAALKAARATAQNKAQKDQFDRMIKALTLRNSTMTLDFMLKGGKAALTKQDNEYLNDYMKTKAEELESKFPNTGGWFDRSGSKQRKAFKQAFKDYHRRNKDKNIDENWANFLKSYNK